MYVIGFDCWSLMCDICLASSICFVCDFMFHILTPQLYSGGFFFRCINSVQNSVLP